MTERERYRTRGLFYYLTNDYQACVKEYGDLISRFAADAAARNNLALCLTYLRNLPRAVAEMQEVVKILPNRTLYRDNLALYAAYSGDFQAAEQIVLAMNEPGLFGRLALALPSSDRASARRPWRPINRCQSSTTRARRIWPRAWPIWPSSKAGCRTPLASSMRVPRPT
jgi:tetratricopeptide (TPR) repeat protein